MKSLKETFVIIDPYDSLFTYFTDNVSFNKEALDKRCIDMNNDFNDKLIASFKPSKKKKPIGSVYEKFKVMSLEEAVGKYHDECADMYIEKDESY